MLRTASIRLNPSQEQKEALLTVRAAYADACNRLVPIVRENRIWNRVGLHNFAYSMLRKATPLGSQMVCNAIFSVCKAYKAQKELGRIRKNSDVPAISFRKTSVHYDKRTYTLKGECVSLYTLAGRVLVPLSLGDYQRRLLDSGLPKEAELVFKRGKWLFNLVLEFVDTPSVASGPVMGLDVGENNLAAISLGKVFGGEDLRDKRDRHLSLRKRLQSNGSQSSRQKLRQVSGKEQRRVTHTNHVVSKEIVTMAQETGVSKITMEDLTHIRNRIKAGKRIRARLHRWAWRQLQTFVEYKALAAGIAVEYTNPAYTSQTCSGCGAIGTRDRHRFTCQICGLRAHSDLNASRNLARIGMSADFPRAAVNTPNVGKDIAILLQ